MGRSKVRPGARSAADDPAERGMEPSWRAAAPLAALALALATLLLYPTLGSSWAYDDIDYINQASRVLAGREPVVATLVRPQGEHIVAGFRVLLFASLGLFGVAATPFRLLVLAAHAASAVFLGLLARRHAGPAAGFAATALYVGACGLSSMWIWYPSGSTVPFATAILTGTMLLLSGEDGPRLRRRLIALLCVAVALFTESTLAPLVGLPIAIDELARRRRGAGRWSLGWWSLAAMALTVAIAGYASWLYTRIYGPRLSLDVLAGVPRAAFLLLSAPFRLLFPGVSVLGADTGRGTALLGSALGVTVVALVAPLLLALWRRGAPRLAFVAAASALGPLAWLGLVGIGRWRATFWELFDADRYYFPLLVPLALLAGAAAATAVARLAHWSPRERRALVALLLLAGAAELVLHRRAMLKRIPFVIYDQHEARFAQLERLADRLDAAARALPPGAPPLAFPDSPLVFPDVHNGYISPAVLVHVMADEAGRRLRLGDTEVSARDQAILNPVLEAWAREIGEPLPYLSVVDGKLVDAHVIRNVDFRRGTHEGAVISGFYGVEGSGRWMGPRGELRLTLNCPEVTLLLAGPVEGLRALGRPPLTVAVTALDEQLGWSTPLGTVEIAEPGIQTYRLPATPFTRRLGSGRIVRLILEAGATWKPSELPPGSPDTRDLSVTVVAAGCE